MTALPLLRRSRELIVLGGLIAAFGITRLLVVLTGAERLPSTPLKVLLGLPLAGLLMALWSRARRLETRGAGVYVLVQVAFLGVFPISLALVLLNPFRFDGGVFEPSGKERAYLASLKSDLRNLVTAEEAYLADSAKYTTNLGTAFGTTSGNVGPTIVVTRDGWTARVVHAATARTCVLYIGTTPLPPATKPGEPACTLPAFPLAGVLGALGVLAFGYLVGALGLPRPQAAG